MLTHAKADFGPYAAKLRALPFVEDARVEPIEPRRGRLGSDAPRAGPAWDAVLYLRVAGREHRFRVEHKRTPRLNYALLEAFLSRVQRHGNARWILFTPYVTSPMANRLQEQGVDYVDLAGNCHLVVDKGHVAVIGGRRPPRRQEDARLAGPARYQVLFALLARPGTNRRTVRDIAGQAGVGKTAAAVALKRLEEEGLIGHTETNTFLLKPKELLDRWLVGYLDVLRPKLLAGYYRAADKDPLALEKRIEQALALFEQTPGSIEPHGERVEDRGMARWAWGGATAAFRLTGHYRGERTVLHMDPRPADLAQRLQLLPARTGEIAILGTPGFFAYEGAAPRTVHPLLVHAELFVGQDDRAREAAAEVRDRFLRHLG